LLGNFKLHRPTGLFLNDGGAISDSAASADIVDLQLREITTSKFAVDRQVEHGEVAGSVLQLKPDPDGPYIPGLQRSFLTYEASLVPRIAPWRRRVSIGHGRLLRTDHALPAPVREQPAVHSIAMADPRRRADRPV
jgi:hypothetical protein